MGSTGWGVYVRHKLDLPLRDILFGMLACGRYWRRERLEAGVLELCAMGEEGLVCFSVRSGWDLWLRVQGLRAGDEVIVSAVTHPDMVRIVRGHGLRAVPVDIDPETLAPRFSALEEALTPRTRVVLVAHLFGGRMDLGLVARFAREHDLLFVEDCAQAFRGPEAMVDPAVDVSMYSFGTLKTSTALGGAVLRVRDREVLSRMCEIQASYPVQRRGRYAKKLLMALGLVVVSRPLPYGRLARFCHRFGHDLDALVNGAVRAFPPKEPETTFFRRLRHGPSAPLLAMLSRRLGTFDRARLARRTLAGERFAGRLAVEAVNPGGGSFSRTHWLFPVVVPDPETMISDLRGHGLDASQATSSIGVVEAPAGCPSPNEASHMMSGVVFLPVYPELPWGAFDAMADLVSDHVAHVALERVAS
jgi:perosamine synthetase